MTAKKIWKKIPLIASLIFLVMACIYLFGLAADRYTSESKFTIKSNSVGSAPAGFDLGMLGGSSVTKQDQLIIRDFLTSNDVMLKVVEKFGLRELSAPATDVLWSVSDDTQSQHLLSHYRSLVELRYDEEASISTLVTQGFSPSITQRMNEFLLSEAEQYINEFSDKTSDAFISFAQNDVARAKQAVAEANGKIREAQDAGQLVDPKTDLEVVAKTLAELEAQIIAAKAELEELRGVYQEDTYQVLSKVSQIEGMERQIDALRIRMANGDGGDLAGASVLFASLQFDLEFANTSYASALKTLEMAKVQAMQSRKHLVIVETPNLPDYPTYPSKFLDLLIVVGSLTLFIAMLSAIVGIIPARD